MTVRAAPEPAVGPPAEPWSIRLEVDEPGSRVVAAIDGTGVMIGLATAGATRGDNIPTGWELYSINVVEQQQGRGLADDLIEAAIADTDTTVWVLADNARAQGFYHRHGFRVDGATTVDEVTGASEMRMVRRSVRR